MVPKTDMSNYLKKEKKLKKTKKIKFQIKKQIK